MQRIVIPTQKRIQVLDVTASIQKCIVPEASMVFIFCPHTTCAIVLNEFEPNLAKDFERQVYEAYQKKWHHDEVDDNAAAHVLTASFGSHVLLPAEKARLLLGTWQRILLIEMDGPRSRELWINLL